jgi:polyphosphate kinase 2 (PPK2 family)
MLQLGVAKELGYTLVRLKAELTLEELLLWSAYFDVTNEEQERRMKQRRR